MGVINSAWVREQSRAQGSARLVMFALASAADDASKRCAVSVPTLSRWAGVEERSVYRALEHLEALGELQVTRRTGRVTGYLLPLPAENDAPNPWQGVTPNPRHRVTPDTVSPLTLDTKRGDTVSQTPDTVSPKKYLKDLKGEKHNISPVSDVDVGGETAQTSTAKDEAYKGQTPAWVAPQAAHDAKSLWADVKRDLELQLNKSTWETYVRDTEAGTIEGDCLTVKMKNPYVHEWLAGRLDRVCRRTLNSFTGRQMTINFVLVEVPAHEPLAELLGVRH